MPVETPKTVTPTTPAAGAPNGAPQTPPAAPPPPSTPETPSEEATARREALRLAQDVRKRDKELGELRARLSQVEDGSKKSAAEREALEALKATDPRAWVEKTLNMPRADLTRLLMSTQKAPDPAEAALKAAQEARNEHAKLRQELADRDQRQAEADDAQKTANAFRILRHEAASDPGGAFALLVEHMDADPKGSARMIRQLADKHPEASAREIAETIQKSQLAFVRKLVNNPNVAKLLGLVQPKPPAAATGTTPPKTITAKLAAERSSVEPPTVTPAALKKQRFEAAVAKLAEIQAKTGS